jgi:hypothetical protein
MESLLIYAMVAQVVTLSLLIYTTVQHARLERAYWELYKVNRINRERLANSAERPF